MRGHRTAIFGYNRVSDGPAMSIVYYVLDADDTILVSTMRERQKARAVRRNPNVSMDSVMKLVKAGLAYVNVHTPANGGGEIRGQLVPKP